MQSQRLSLLSRRLRGKALSAAGATKTAWTTDLESRIATAGETGNVPQSHIDAMDTFYQYEIDAGRLPADLANGTGDWVHFAPLLGSTIGSKLIAAITPGQSAMTNNGAVAADINADGSITGDGTFDFDTGIIFANQGTTDSYSVFTYMNALDFAANSFLIRVGSSIPRVLMYTIPSLNRLLCDGLANCFISNFSTLGFVCYSTETDGSGGAIGKIRAEKTELDNRVWSSITNAVPSEEPLKYLDSLNTHSCFGVLNQYLSDTDIDNINDNVTTLMTALGRNV